MPISNPDYLKNAPTNGKRDGGYESYDAVRFDFLASLLSTDFLFKKE